MSKYLDRYFDVLGYLDLPSETPDGAPKRGALSLLLEEWMNTKPSYESVTAGEIPALTFKMLAGRLRNRAVIDGATVIERDEPPTQESMRKNLEAMRGHLLYKTALPEIAALFSSTDRDADIKALEAAHASDVAAWKKGLETRMNKATSAFDFVNILSVYDGHGRLSDFMLQMWQDLKLGSTTTFETFRGGHLKGLKTTGKIRDDFVGMIRQFSPASVHGTWDRLVAQARAGQFEPAPRPALPPLPEKPMTPAEPAAHGVAPGVKPSTGKAPAHAASVAASTVASVSSLVASPPAPPPKPLNIASVRKEFWNVFNRAVVVLQLANDKDQNALLLGGNALLKKVLECHKANEPFTPDVPPLDFRERTKFSRPDWLTPDEFQALRDALNMKANERNRQLFDKPRVPLASLTTNPSKPSEALGYLIALDRLYAAGRLPETVKDAPAKKAVKGR